LTADTETPTRSAGPLAGIRVVDLTHLIAGPFCTMHLADAGADVVKVEPPEGEIARHRVPARDVAGDRLSAYFTAVNRGKRSLVLDLKTGAGQASLERLLTRADILVTNYRSRALDRLGLGPHGLREKYPSLIVATISAFGHDDATAAAGQPGIAIVAEAISGVTSLAQDREGRPTWVGFALGDFVAGLTAFGAVVTALHARDTTGQGSYLDISMAESLLAFNGISLAGAMFKHDEDGQWPAERETPVPYGVYPALDGYVAIGVNSDKFWSSLCDAMGRPDLRSGGLFDTQKQRMDAREEVNAIVTGWTQSLGKAAVVRALNENGVPGAPLNQPEDIIGSEILAERAALVPVELNGQRVAIIPAPAMGFPRRDGYVLPRLGQHTAEVLGELDALDGCGVAS
jgi:crotonobetainyl-CoA:carnitine CoA-transferase CaiB-like acyl-CoA transferase